MTPMWKKLMKKISIGEPTSILGECKPNETIIEQYTKMFESRISVEQTEKLPGW